MQPLVKFLAEGDHAQWRYVTFGLGDQLAYLSRLTKATTIDGSYHTARTLPELRASGLGQIDTAYWLSDGFSRLDPILQKSGERGVRWGFVNRLDYIPILQRNGWVYLTTLTNNIQVWENPQAVIPPPVQPPAESPLEQFSWGVFPLLALSVAGGFALLRLTPIFGQKILFGIHTIAIGLIPISLCFWYYRPLVVIDHPGVYFTYDNALIFLSDALAAIAILAWAIAWMFGPPSEHAPVSTPLYSRLSTWLFGLCLLASLSILWSQDWRTSAYTSLHLWLVFGLFLSLQDQSDTWRAFALGSVGALSAQVIVGLWQFGAQSTAFLKPLGLNWPGDLTPATVGASVVQLADGMRWLRVYGTLPHPNILGGLIFVFLAGLTALYLNQSRLSILLLPLFGLGLILLLVTFSRSAWLAFAVFTLVIVIHFRSFDRKRLIILAVFGMTCLVLVIIPLWPLVFTRSGNMSTSTETFSFIARTWLAQESWLFIRERPLSGLGIGTFIIELAQRATYGYIIEPVHNIPLLVVSELGIVGGLLFVGLAAIIVVYAVRALSSKTIVFSATMVGLGVIAMLDHYLWTLAPGRMILSLTLGILAGQVRLHEGNR